MKKSNRTKLVLTNDTQPVADVPTVSTPQAETNAPEPVKRARSHVFIDLYDLVFTWSGGGVLTRLGPTLSIGQIASAIDVCAIYGRDRFGRFNKYQPESPESKMALDYLAKIYTDLKKVDIDIDELPMSDFGWYEDELPDFDSFLNKDMPHEPPAMRGRPGGIGKGDATRLRMIGALLEFIDGSSAPKKHPNYISDPVLIRDITQQNYEGLKDARSVRDVIADARGRPPVRKHP